MIALYKRHLEYTDNSTSFYTIDGTVVGTQRLDLVMEESQKLNGGVHMA